MIKFIFNAKSTINSLENLISELPKAVNQSLLEVAEVGKKVAQDKSTGELRKSIEIKVIDGVVELFTEKKYAQWVEFGRGPVYASSPKRPLAFTINGKKIFAQKVGPAKPKPFMKPASTKIIEILEKTVEKNILSLI